jgi:hypothetical protein
MAKCGKNGGNSSRVAACALWPLAETIEHVQPVFFCTKTFAQDVPDTWLRHLQFSTCTICWFLRAPDTSFPVDGPSRPVRFAVHRQPLMNCSVHRWFCVIFVPKPPSHHHSWLSFGKFQNTELFLIPCPCLVSSWLPPSGETCKYTMAPITQTNLERFSTYWYAPFCFVHLGCCTAELGNPGGAFELLLWPWGRLSL